jgi:hypothetical protein
MITDRGWVKTTGHGASLMLAAAGVFVVVGSVFTPTLGSTRSAKLAWEKSARDAATSVDGPSPVHAPDAQREAIDPSAQ